MTSSASGARTRAQFLRSCLALAVLVPIGVLFGQLWQTQSDQLSFAAKERNGIAYLNSLSQVTIALTDAQSAAVSGGTVDQNALARAVDAASAIDQRLGGELRTNDRWSGLRAKIEALPSTASDPHASYTAYGEVTDLLLALYGKVRENSQLIRDPDGDTYFLQDGAAEELPEAVIAAGRFTDLVVMANAEPHQDHQQEALSGLAAARQDVLDPAGDLTDDLQSAVDSTNSRNLGGNLLSRLDRLNRSMDTLAASAGTLDGEDALPRADQVKAARTEVQAAATDLSTAILAELDTQIAQRADGLRTQRWISIGAVALAILLAVTPAIAALTGRRRRQPTPSGGGMTGVHGVPATVPTEWERAGAAR
ncbi:hypothetical protein WEI85_11520 [Actinomycetes bacterium KLBMP 9797]